MRSNAFYFSYEENKKERKKIRRKIWYEEDIYGSQLIIFLQKDKLRQCLQTPCCCYVHIQTTSFNN